MGRKTTLMAAFLLAFLLSASVGSQLTLLARANYFPYPGPDLPRIYIRSDGTVEPPSALIARVGSSYQLMGGIVLFTVEIQRDNVVLDGAGYSIQGNGSWLGYDAGNNGVVVAGRNNVTVTRLVIAQCYVGVRVSNSSRVSVIGNTFTNGTTEGVTAKDSSLVMIEGNSFASIYGPAVICNGSANTIRGNSMTNGAYGIKLEGSSNLISENRIEMMLPIILDRADSNVIARNNISGPAPSPQFPGQSSGNEGIALFRSCSNNIVFGNTLTGFANQAIRITDGANNTVYGNYLSKNQYAVALGGLGWPVNNTFYGNIFTTDSCNVSIHDSDLINFWDNGTIGNYWSNYNGTDTNGDGIGDTPNILDANNTDRFPLINEVESAAITLTTFPSASPSSLSSASASPTPTSSPTTQTSSPSSPSEQPASSPETKPVTLPPEVFYATAAAAVAIIATVVYILRKKPHSNARST